MQDLTLDTRNKTERRIYPFYAGAKPRVVAVAAARDGILKREEVGDELLSDRSALIEAFSKVPGDTAA